MTLRPAVLAAAALLASAAVAGPAAASDSGRPTITSFSPAAGAVNSIVTIDGTHLDTIDGWALGSIAPGFWYLGSPASIRVQIPEGAVDGRFEVFNSLGSGVSRGSFHILPGIDSFDPWEAFPGDDVVLHGHDLTGATSVKVNGVTAQFSVLDDQTIELTVPRRAESGPVTVKSRKGTGTSTLDLVVIRPPTISSFSPSAGVIGGKVKVFGTHLDSVESVTVDGIDVGPVNHFRVDRSPMPNKLGFVVPAGVVHGRIEITNPAGSALSAKAFDVPVEVESVDPDHGYPGDGIEIDGRGFSHATKVAVGGVTARFTILDDSTIQATVPRTTGSDVEVTVRGVTAWSHFVRVLAPTIESFHPIAAIGDLVLVKGRYLPYGTGAVNGVDVGEIHGNPFGWSWFPVPDGASTGSLTFANLAGSVTAATPLVVAPRVDDFDPKSGRTGTAVTIEGASFTGAVKVFLGSDVADFTVLDDSTIRAVVPAAAGRGRVVVTTRTGDGAAYESSGSSQRRFVVLGALEAAPVGERAHG